MITDDLKRIAVQKPELTEFKLSKDVAMKLAMEFWINQPMLHSYDTPQEMYDAMLEGKITFMGKRIIAS